MATKEKAKSALPYVRQLLEDEYVHEQLREAALGLRNAYGRAATKRAQAADDKRLYGSLRRAATSIRNAATALRKPEPPPKRRARKLLIIGLAAGCAALLIRLGRPRQDAGASPPATAASAVPSTGNGSVQMETAATSS